MNDLSNAIFNADKFEVIKVGKKVGKFQIENHYIITLFNPIIKYEQDGNSIQLESKELSDLVRNNPSIMFPRGYPIAVQEPEQDHTWNNIQGNIYRTYEGIYANKSINTVDHNKNIGWYKLTWQSEPKLIIQIAPNFPLKKNQFPISMLSLMGIGRNSFYNDLLQQYTQLR